MGLGAYLGGVLGCAICLALVTAAALAGTRRLGLGAAGSASALVTILIALSVLLVALELAGMVGILEIPGILGCTVIVSGAVLLSTRRGRASPVASRVTGEPIARLDRAWLVVVVAVVAAPWLGWTYFSYRHGMQTVDTLWYHMPFAARFMQTHSIVHLQYVDADPVEAFYPANSELLQTFGLVMFHNDWTSPLLELGWGALSIFAGWTFGRPYRAQVPCAGAVTIVLGTTDLVVSQPGGTYADVVCIALMLSALAVLANNRHRSGAIAVAALTGGLAVGTKFTMIAPVLALAVGELVIAQPAARLRHAGLWVAGLVTTGGFWYGRNLAANGNPFGSVPLHLGPLALPYAHSSTGTSTIAQYLTDGRVWSMFFLPGLRSAFGPAWWALFACAGLGVLAVVLAPRDRLLLVAAATTVVSLAGIIVTPQVMGPSGAPTGFVDNLRYETVPLALGVVLLAAHARLRAPTPRRALLVVFGVALALTEADVGVWGWSGFGSARFMSPLHGHAALAGVIGGLAVAGAGALTLTRWRGLDRPWRRRLAHGGGAVLATGAVLFAGAGFAVARSYTHRRYRDAILAPQVFAWAQGLHHSRIGVIGIFVQYPLTGTDSSNYVQYIGAPAPHAGFGPVTSCLQWRALVGRGRYRYVVIAPRNFPLSVATAPEAAWTAASPRAHLVLREHPAGFPPSEFVTVFRIDGPLGRRGCPGPV
jgi:hypothetical protein